MKDQSSKNKRVDELIQAYNLQPHPEGGYFSEVYRSPIHLPELNRDVMTSIYFLLTSDQPSNFHRIKSDEIWFFHEGNSLTVHTLDENGHQCILVGNDSSNGEQPQALVPANTIFGSSIEVNDGFAFVSCVVAPGFDFKDFELFEREDLENQFPDHKEIIHRLTR